MADSQDGVFSNVINRAEDLISRFSLSHWDSMVVAAYLEANVQTLYTEDFGYISIDGLKIVNPFKIT
jgi:predicted nucleic acid-binding protein